MHIYVYIYIYIFVYIYKGGVCGTKFITRVKRQPFFMEQKIHNEICLTWVNELSINQKKEEISGSSCAFDLTWLKTKGCFLMSTDPVCY